MGTSVPCFIANRQKGIYMRKIIDVSSYQGIINWKQVKTSGIEGAILKVIRKDLEPDKQFEDNWKGCMEAGMPVTGVYNYSYATTEAKAIADAQKVVQILNGRKTKVWLDVEDSCQKKLGMKLISIIKAYQKIIAGAGLEFGVYTGLSFYNSYIKPYQTLLDCNFWIARYPSSAKLSAVSIPADKYKPAIVHILEGWQFGSTARISGINGDVDINLWYEEKYFTKTVSTVYGGLDYALVFDASYYAERYRDLKAAYGTDGALLFYHFIAHGMSEGRQAIDTFSVQAYKARYQDLQKAFGENLPLYYQHYIRFGAAEGRKAL